MDRCEQHVVGHDRLGKALEGERADLFTKRGRLDIGPSGQHMTRSSAEPRR